MHSKCDIIMQMAYKSSITGYGKSPLFKPMC